MVSDETADYWVYAKKLAISVITACTLNRNIRSHREIKFNFDTIIHLTSPSLRITLRLCNAMVQAVVQGRIPHLLRWFW